MINVARTFQEPTIEPLGDDWHAEVTNLRQGKMAATAAIEKTQTNADPGLAQLRSDAACVQRAYLALPDEEACEALLQHSAALRAEAEQLVAAAGLQPTEVRAGKQQRRRQQRNPEDRVVKALQPWRNRPRCSSAAGQEMAPENRCDPLPQLGKRGIAVNKVRACSMRAGKQTAEVMSSSCTATPLQVRGVTVAGNLDGTLLRNGAAHHRMPKQARR